MSLVEKALKKMQDAQRAPEVVARSPDLQFGRVVTKSPQVVDVGRQVAMPVHNRVVEINQEALREAGLLPPEHQDRQIAQQYRQIKRPLIANATGNGAPRLPNGQLIMMASAVPGEGKTFTSINLAFSMALERDLSVLLVDADLPKPHITKLFGLEGQPGLLDVLKDSSLDVESVVLPTSVPGLFVLPAGKREDNATEMLASHRMSQVAASLGERDPTRIVLFDSAPLLLTTEAPALAQIVGQIVIVVRAGITPQEVVREAVGLLEGKSVSIVLNQSVTATTPHYYYYGYGDAANPNSPPG